METPEGQTILDWIKQNRVLNMDVDAMVSRGTLLFLQFNNLMNKVTDIESKMIRLNTLLENNAHMLREIKRIIS
jgi:archaellum biogenesis ATPase FlaH